MRKFTVLLLYPDYLAETFGHDTHLTRIAAESPHAAIGLAQLEARRNANFNGAADGSHEDFHCLLCVEGRHFDARDADAMPRADVDAAWRKIHGAIDARPCDSEPAA